MLSTVKRYANQVQPSRTLGGMRLAFWGATLIKSINSILDPESSPGEIFLSSLFFFQSSVFLAEQLFLTRHYNKNRSIEFREDEQEQVFVEVEDLNFSIPFPLKGDHTHLVRLHDHLIQFYEHHNKNNKRLLQQLGFYDEQFQSLFEMSSDFDLKYTKDDPEKKNREFFSKFSLTMMLLFQTIHRHVDCKNVNPKNILILIMMALASKIINFFQLEDNKKFQIFKLQDRLQGVEPNFGRYQKHRTKCLGEMFYLKDKLNPNNKDMIDFVRFLDQFFRKITQHQFSQLESRHLEFLRQKLSKIISQDELFPNHTQRNKLRR